MAPILLIVVAIAGLAFSEAAAQNAIVGMLASLAGRKSAEVLQDAIKSYAAAGALLVVLLGVYYSSEVFLLGAELTRAYSVRTVAKDRTELRLGRPLGPFVTHGCSSRRLPP
jgi:uncharacterized BrkB/YihY/UPF0761 family membrane protein